MSRLEKLQPVLIVLSAAIGLLLARTNRMTNLAEGAIEPLLMILLYATFLRQQRY